MYQKTFKPLIDMVFGIVSLVVLSPILVGAALAILIEDGRPIFFVHERIGKGGRPFQIMKFRSMEKNSRILPSADASDLRTTRVGRVIRRLNIDELPQLFNVIRQDMSLIGPRPGLPSQTDLHNSRHANGSIELRPGISGLAQINSYDGMTVDEKAAWDGRYAETISFVTDVKIVSSTIGYLRKRPPAY